MSCSIASQHGDPSRHSGACSRSWGARGPSARPPMKRTYVGLLVSEGSLFPFDKPENESGPWFC